MWIRRLGELEQGEEVQLPRDTMDGARDQSQVSEVLTPWGGQRQHSQVSAQLRESKGAGDRGAAGRV